MSHNAGGFLPGQPSYGADSAAALDTMPSQPSSGAFDRIVAMDTAALRALPPNAHLNLIRLSQGVKADDITLLPRPALWLQDEWAITPFVFLGNDARGYNTAIARYRCALHRLDGRPCGDVIECNLKGYKGAIHRPNPALFLVHLLQHHGIAEIPPVPPLRQWRSGLLEDCCCKPVCLDCVVAPCCFVGRMMWLLENHADDVVPSFDSDAPLSCCHPSKWVVVSMSWAVWPCILVLPCLPDWGIRQRLVKLHNIDESCCQTYCISYWCCPCSALQVHREISSAGIWPGYCCYTPPKDALPTTADEVLRRFGGPATTRDDVARLKRATPTFTMKPIQ